MELKLSHVTKRYGNLEALSDFSITFKPGIYGILGANGVGKIIRLFLLLLVALCCGCSSERPQHIVIDSTMFEGTEYDVDNRYLRSNGEMCRSESIYYISTNTFLWYYDQISGTYGKLCGKPECTHDVKSCNAFLEGGSYSDGIQVYDGKLYYGNGQGILYRMDLTGNNRESVMSMWTGTGTNFKWIIHRGYLYRTGNLQVVENGQSKSKLKISRKPLGKNDDEEILIEIPDMQALDNWLIQGNTLFLDLSYGAWGKREFYMYDLEKGELTKLIDERFNGYIADYLVDEEGITFLGRTWDEHYVFRYDFAEKKDIELFRVKTELETNSRLSMSGEYVIIYETADIQDDGILEGWIFSVDDDRKPISTYEMQVELNGFGISGWGSDEYGFYLERTYSDGNGPLKDIWRITYDGSAECLMKTKSMYHPS